MKQILIPVTMIMFLAGCGGGGSTGSTANGSDGNPNTFPRNVSMEISELYTVYPGDQVIKDGNNTLIKITHTDEHNESTIELVQGEATIIYQ